MASQLSESNSLLAISPPPNRFPLCSWLNIPLVILEADTYSETKIVLHKFCQDHNIKNLYFNVEYPINELNRDREIFHTFKENGIGVFHFHDQEL